LWMRWWTFGFWRHGVSWLVTIRPTCFNNQCNSSFCVCGFRMILSVNSHYFLTLHKPIGLCRSEVLTAVSTKMAGRLIPVRSWCSPEDRRPSCRLVFVTAKCFVPFEVRTELLNMI
jgi:hypothetical protein